MPLARTFRPCRHLFTDGHQCGSPALRGEELCFYHHSTRRPIRQQVLHGITRATLPEPLDLHAVQRGLAELLRLTAAELIDLKLAATLHRQLSSASQNLARIERAEARAEARAQALHLDRTPVTDYTNHPTLGTIATEPEAPGNEQGAPGLEPETRVSSATGPQTGLQTQPQSIQDFETSQQIVAATPEREAGCPTFGTVSPCLRWDPSEAPESPAGITPQAPLPDPIARFTLPPEPEFLESKAKLAAAEEAYANAYNKLAEGIHDRAQARAKLHDALFPLDTLVREQDQDDMEYDPQVALRVEGFQQQETAA